MRRVAVEENESCDPPQVRTQSGRWNAVEARREAAGRARFSAGGLRIVGCWWNLYAAAPALLVRAGALPI